MSKTYEELCSQYDAMQKTAAHIDEVYESIVKWIDSAAPKQVVFIGCGSSYSVSKSLADTAYMHLHVNARAIAAGDLLLHAKRYAGSLKGALIISISRSGSTSEIVLAVEALREAGCAFSFLSVSGVADSPLDAKASMYIDLPWIFDESVCQTRTVSCLYFAGAYFMSKFTGDADAAELLNYIAWNGPEFLQSIEEQCKAIASEDWDRVVALGDAEIAGLCEEGALAFAEICQIPSNFYHLLDSRHGPMVLISDKTLVIAAISDVRNSHEMKLLSDIVKNGARVIAVSEGAIEMEGVNFIRWGYTPCREKGAGDPAAHFALGFPFILTCQLIAYYKSFQTGANPDSPDGLDPWIKL